MSGTWWTRVVIIVLSVVWAGWTLYPTIFIEPSAADRAKAQVAELESGKKAEKAEERWFDFLIADARLSLGLDLQGGLDLSLEVDVDAALDSVVKRELLPIRESARRDGVGLVDVRKRPGEAVVMLQPEVGVGLSDTTAFMEKRFPRYEYNNNVTEGGVEWLTYRLTDAEAKSIRESAVEQALETLRNRIDETGVREPSIVRQGENRISVQIPGLVDPSQAAEAIGTTALLEFKMVDEELSKDQPAMLRLIEEAKAQLAPEAFLSDDELNEHLWRGGKLPQNRRLMFEYVRGEDNKLRRADNPDLIYIVIDEVMIAGDDINSATTAQGQMADYEVIIQFKPLGARKFAEITEKNVGRRFAIILDGQVRSAPSIKQAILGGTASISMGAGSGQQQFLEASNLALVLRTGSLPAPVTIGGKRQIGPGLGADAIRDGKLATGIGFGLVVLFMVSYYRMSGVVSIIAIILNVLFGFAMMAAAGATLTLPGITGIALTIGMAVDCNIVIYERIREELRLGRNSRAATDTGFDKALWGVLDSNITTMIAGVVLYTYGTGPIRGFAVTLMIGIISTLYTGIFVSRTLMDFLTRKASARLSI